MIKSRSTNIAMLSSVAKYLGDLTEKVVFVGGCATGLLITDPAIPEVRVTQDVDAIVEVISRMEYYRLEEKLRGRGFIQDMSEEAPVCRWLVNAIKVDIMPTQEEILGFTNRWYVPAIRNAFQMEIAAGLLIRLVTAPYFLATKIEAFEGRGHGDYMASHDLEDFIAVLDGRPGIDSEIKQSSEDLQSFLSDKFTTFLKNEDFIDALPGHLPPDRASQARLPKLIKLIEKIAEA